MTPRIVLRFFAFILCAGPLVAQPTPSAPAPASPGTVTVAYWNVQWFPGRRPNASRGEETRQIRAVHADLASLGSDLIALEEVRDFEHAALAVKPRAGFKVDVCS